MTKKILICGVGSIGERHVRNLLTLGYENLILYRTKNLSFRTIKQEFPLFTSLSEALEEKPDVAFICNPTHLHLETAITCAKSGCHLFIEKPLTHDLSQVKTLNTVLEMQNKQAMVGYMMRFHPCLKKMQEWISSGKIGKIVYARTQWGEYLPDWHPWEDYRQSYAANKNIGGGPALTLSHEIDMMLWLFGKVRNVKGLMNHNSSLEIDAEHAVDLLIQFENGITANIHLDYIQKPPARNTEIIGDQGKIYFDYYQNEIRAIFSLEGQEQEVYKAPEDFDRNQLFIDELKYFFECLQKREPFSSNVNNAVEVVKCALHGIQE
jgi:predicted dehydrogenase